MKKIKRDDKIKATDKETDPEANGNQTKLIWSAKCNQQKARQL